VSVKVSFITKKAGHNKQTAQTGAIKPNLAGSGRHILGFFFEFRYIISVREVQATAQRRPVVQPLYFRIIYKCWHHVVTLTS